MLHRMIACSMALMLLLAGISCTKLGKPGTGEQKLVLDKLAESDAIPLKWGKLISVSGVPGIDNWAQLWLQDEEGTIRIVTYDVGGNYLSSQVRVIRRN